jgi:uncharacterized UPF0146 family protein
VGVDEGEGEGEGVGVGVGEGEGEGVGVGVGPMQTWFADALRQHNLAVWQTDIMTKRQSHKVCV